MNKINFWTKQIEQSTGLTSTERISEVLFGLIMVLSFTGAINVASDGKEEIKDLLYAALGCNIAWGLVDAIMYLMDVLSERGHSMRIIQQIQQSTDVSVSRKVFKDETPPLIASLMNDEEVDHLNEKIKSLPAPNGRNILSFRDMLAAIQIFLLVFLCTFPVVLPFTWYDDVQKALRVSNGIAIGMLFLGGYLFAKYAGFHKLLTALIYMGIGVALVFLTIALGG